MAKRKFTPAKAYSAWLFLKTMTREEAGKKLRVSADTVSRWAAKLEEDPDLMKEAKKSHQKLVEQMKHIHSKANGQPKNGEKKEAIRSWMQKNPKGTYQDFLEATGIKNINANYFHQTRHKIRRESGKAQEGDLDFYRDRCAYLEWWNDGERQGFVDRLLDDIADN